MNLKCDVFDDSSKNGVKQSLLFSFVSNKPSVYRVFCQPETIDYEKLNKCVLNTITFYSKDNDHKEVGFNGEALTFTLQLIKI